VLVWGRAWNAGGEKKELPTLQAYTHHTQRADGFTLRGAQRFLKRKQQEMLERNAAASLTTAALVSAKSLVPYRQCSTCEALLRLLRRESRRSGHNSILDGFSPDFPQTAHQT
jgi:hypothetical protein